MSGLRAFSVAELLNLPKPEWLVEGYLPEGGFLAVTGPPGEGKTFVALDLALCVATGTPWHGHTVRKSYVIYISAEGGGGIGKRVGAWLDTHGYTPADYDAVLASFVLSTIAVHPESADLNSIIEATILAPAYQLELASYLAEDETAPPPFIIIDTLARCFLGNENQQEDMGAFVRALDTMREEHAATTLVVHHTNKGGSTERGSNVLRGACDTMVGVEMSGDTITVSCEKQKDAEGFAELAFELCPVEKWESCVLERAEARYDREVEEKQDVVVEYFLENPKATIRQTAKALGISRSATHRIKAKMPPGWDKGLGQG